MRRLCFVLVAIGSGLAAVALASASTTASGRKAAAPESANSYLPRGDVPCKNDWPTNDCDLAGTSFSQLTQINRSNVAQLKVAWQVSLETPGDAITWPPQNKPIVVRG